MNRKELENLIEYQLALGIQPRDLQESIRTLATLEKRIRFRKKDRKRQRIMRRPSTRAKLRRAASRPANKRRLSMGHKRWLKSKGRNILKRTAKRRFESADPVLILKYKDKYKEIASTFESEDVRLVVSEGLIDIDRIIEHFSKFVDFGEDMSKLEKSVFLFKNFNEEFTDLFIEELLSNGIIMDQVVSEDTMAVDVHIPVDAEPISGKWFKNQKKKSRKSSEDEDPFNSFLIKRTLGESDTNADYLPYTVKEIICLIEDFIENEEEDDIKSELIDLQDDLQDALDNADEDSERTDLEDFVSYMQQLVDELSTSSEEEDPVAVELVELAAQEQLRMKYSETVVNLAKSGTKISEQQLKILKKKLGGDL